MGITAYDVLDENERLQKENERLQEAKRAALKVADERSKEACALRQENERLRTTLEKIKNEEYTKEDLETRGCEQPEMIWQSVARRALQ